MIKKIRELERKKEVLRRELWKSRGKPPETLGLLFIPFGAIALISSVILNSVILSYIGLGSLWGALLLLIRETKYVKNKLLDSIAMSSLLSIGRLIEALNYKGKGIRVFFTRMYSNGNIIIYKINLEKFP